MTLGQARVRPPRAGTGGHEAFVAVRDDLVPRLEAVTEQAAGGQHQRLMLEQTLAVAPAHPERRSWRSHPLSTRQSKAMKIDGAKTLSLGVDLI